MLVFRCSASSSPSAFHRWDRRASMSRQQAFKAFGAELLDGIRASRRSRRSARARPMLARSRPRARDPSNSTMQLLVTSLVTRGVTDIGIAVGAAAALGLGALPRLAWRE